MSRCSGRRQIISIDRQSLGRVDHYCSSSASRTPSPRARTTPFSHDISELDHRYGASHAKKWDCSHSRSDLPVRPKAANGLASTERWLQLTHDKPVASSSKHVGADVPLSAQYNWPTSIVAGERSRSQEGRFQPLELIPTKPGSMSHPSLSCTPNTFPLQVLEPGRTDWDRSGYREYTAPQTLSAKFRPRTSETLTQDRMPSPPSSLVQAGHAPLSRLAKPPLVEAIEPPLAMNPPGVCSWVSEQAGEHINSPGPKHQRRHTIQMALETADSAFSTESGHKPHVHSDPLPPEITENPGGGEQRTRQSGRHSGASSFLHGTVGHGRIEKQPRSDVRKRPGDGPPGRGPPRPQNPREGDNKGAMFHCVFKGGINEIDKDCHKKYKYVSHLKRHHDRHDFYPCDSCFKKFDSNTAKDAHTCVPICATEGCPNFRKTRNAVQVPCTHRGGILSVDKWRLFFRLARPGETIPELFPEANETIQSTAQPPNFAIDSVAAVPPQSPVVGPSTYTHDGDSMSSRLVSLSSSLAQTAASLGTLEHSIDEFGRQMIENICQHIEIDRRQLQQVMQGAERQSAIMTSLNAPATAMPTTIPGTSTQPAPQLQYLRVPTAPAHTHVVPFPEDSGQSASDPGMGAEMTPIGTSEPPSSPPFRPIFAPSPGVLNEQNTHLLPGQMQNYGPDFGYNTQVDLQNMAGWQGSDHPLPYGNVPGTWDPDPGMSSWPQHRHR